MNPAAPDLTSTARLTALAAGAVALLVAVGAQPARAAPSLVEGEAMSLPSSQGVTFADAEASGGRALLIWSNAAATAAQATTGIQGISVRVRGDQCAGAPRIVVAIDGRAVISDPVASASWAVHAADVAVPDGDHTVTVSFTNDYKAAGCDRNLRVDSVNFWSSPGFEGEWMSLPATQGAVYSETAAAGGRALMLWSNSAATAHYTTAAAQGLDVRARGDQCAGAPQMLVGVDGATVLSRAVPSTSWATYSTGGTVPAGPHLVTISFTNDYMAAGCDRNLRIDRLAPSAASANPFAGAKWYLDPNSNARRQAAAWRASRPADAAQMDKVAGQPQADWFGGWSGEIQSAVAARVAAIRAAGALPVLVAYNIPKRDCGSFSGGGASSADAYRSWIRSFAAGLGSGKAVVVLEPDALAGMDCLSAADRGTRVALLRDAVEVLASRPGVSAYLDAGNSRWQSAGEIASRLKSAGVDRARGFSLNVSNYHPTAQERGYGDAVSALTGGKPFLIDTSRNGLGSNGEWCNASGRALGERPTAATGDPLADAYFWVKRPGESDGSCNGGPPAGSWWAEYALGLARRAAY